MHTKAMPRNDVITGLKRKIVIGKKSNGVSTKSGEMRFSYNGKYGQGYDGCGCHTHKD